MNYLITGGAGFIGSHLADRLIARNDSVVALDDLSTGSVDNVGHLKDERRFRLEHGSILDPDIVRRLTVETDVVVHLAAAVGVKLIVERPLSPSSRTSGAPRSCWGPRRQRKKILVTSTSEIYGKNANGPLREDADRILGSPLKSRWSYSTAKAADEMLAHAYRRERGTQSVVARLFNTVGPRQTGVRDGRSPLRPPGAPGRGSPSTATAPNVAASATSPTSSMRSSAARSPEAVGGVFNVGSQRRSRSTSWRMR